jgi:hypothetical protein
MSDADIPLLTAAYNALVENCVYEPDYETQREAWHVIRGLAERLKIQPTVDVRLVLALDE